MIAIFGSMRIFPPICARKVDSRAVDRFDRLAHFVGNGVGGDADRDVANDARSGDRVHVDGANGSPGIADRIGKHTERARLVRRLDP